MTNQAPAPRLQTAIHRHRLSLTGFVLGVASFAGLWLTVLVPIAAIIVSTRGLRQEPTGRAYAIAGITLGAWGISSLISLLTLWFALPAAFGWLGAFLNDLDIDGTRAPRGL